MFTMTERLRQKINQFLVKKGPIGKSELSVACGKSVRMVERYVEGKAKPSQHTGYKIALACGCNEREALELSALPAEEPVAG